MAEDWGFQYAATTNLQKVHEYASASNLLAGEDKATVLERVGELKTAIDAQPKSTKWKVRSRIGPKKKWYNEVETVIR